MPFRPRQILSLLIAGSATLGMAAPAGASSLGASEQGTSLSTFSAALRELVAMPGGPPGAIAVVQVGQRTQVVAAGVGDVASKQPPPSNDTARIASVSKAYNGAITLALVSQGSLSL